MADITAAAPVDDHATIDPIEIIIARAKMEELSDRRAVRQAAAGDGPTNIEVARLLARVIFLAAEKLRISPNVGMDELLRLILARARGGGLDAAVYRIVWALAHPPTPPRAAS
jgi:hypothetical protein